jgi:hypothetical protein
MHLTEPSTRQHFLVLVELVERWLRGALPAEVVERLGPDEQKLFSFYEDLEKNLSRLQAALKE